MPFDINEFKSAINSGDGLMKTNKYVVTIPAPIVMLDSINVARNLVFFCENVNFPGYMLTTHGVRRYGYGPIEKRPFGPNFTQLQCLFMNDNKNQNWEFFNNWLSRIIPHDTSQGIDTSINGQLPYEVEYKVNYLTDIHIDIYDDAGVKRSRVVCKEAFPSQVPDTPLSWSDNNNNLKFQVAFEFQDWYYVKPDNNE
jgi:hypothetical protein